MGRAQTLSARSAALVVLLLLTASGCSSSGETAHGAATVARITERDYKITAPRYELAPGDVDLSVTNRGPDAHELIVVRESSSGLAMSKDGLRVDEDAMEHQTLGALEPGQPGGVRHMRVRLTAGRYLLLCNMAGHYLGGMHTELVVR
jgi:uncharacterized cupredoxin-like copper-binding protein